MDISEMKVTYDEMTAFINSKINELKFMDKNKFPCFTNSAASLVMAEAKLYVEAKRHFVLESLKEFYDGYFFLTIFIFFYNIT